ncbi:MAG: hypothetical protein KDD43_07480 [Bdellovibrionales bacterium]|nr:hypothetical protein [Bdellovibrionales bacterium]
MEKPNTPPPMGIGGINQELANIQEKLDNTIIDQVFLMERRKGYLMALRDIISGKISIQPPEAAQSPPFIEGEKTPEVPPPSKSEGSEDQPKKSPETNEKK